MKVDKIKIFYWREFADDTIKTKEVQTQIGFIEEFMEGKEIVGVYPTTPNGILVHYREEKD